MKASFYEELQHNFVMIRHMQYPDCFDKEKYDKTILSIKEARKKIEMHSVPSEKKVLLYCIDTLFEIIEENETTKILDFSDAIHNIPEIYMGRREINSFTYELKAFRKKYGEEFFPFLNDIKSSKKGPTPYFYTTLPKNSGDFFYADSDEDFKTLYPKVYWILGSTGIFVLVLPTFVLAIFAPSSANWVAGICGIIGSFAIGVGLFNIVAAWIHQYLGHIFTAICLTSGAALVWLCFFLS